jgi:quercetin dioxygenase-like cupin family protein
MSENTGVFPPSEAIELAALVAYDDGAVVSKTLRKAANGNVSVFAFDKGQELSEHSAPFDAYVQVLDGTVELIIGGESVIASAGEMVLMPANVPHAVKAIQRFKMLLLMFKG